MACLLIVAAKHTHAADHPKPSPIPQPMIVVVDMQSTLHQSLAAQSIAAQLDTQREAYKSEVMVLEDKLRATDQALAQLAAGSDNTPPDKTQFDERRRVFETEVGAVQRLAQTRKRALDDAFNEASNIVVARLRDIVGEVSRQRGANIVLNRQQVILANDAMDITPQVLTRLNEVLPTVAVSVHPDSDDADAKIIDDIRKR